jgi:SAM-dependent methyltransferase/RimJ/RimL family protein N-acetyltransferase
VPELQRLQADHGPAVLAFEQENRAYFSAFISDRGDDFFARFAEHHSAMVAEQEAGTAAFYVLVDGDGSVLGRFNLFFTGDGTANVGYRVARHVAGRGVTTVTVRELCGLAGSRHGLHTLMAAAPRENVASQKVLAKAGFVPVGPAGPGDLGGKLGTWYRRDLAAGDEGPQPHWFRQVAESFGEDAGRYDRTRPAYPAALVERVAAASPGTDVLDVGCGTGTASRQFMAAGCTVLGVEPDERMAGFARGTGVAVEVAAFEAWDSAGRCFDAVVAGTAWHWVDPVAGPAKAARVLRPGGRLAPFHHVSDPPAAVNEALASAYRQVVPDSPVRFSERQAGSALDIYQAMFDRIADGIRQAGCFSEPEQWRFPWEREYTRDEWLDQLPTLGILTRLEPGPLAVILDRVGAAIDVLGGRITVPYTTVAVTAARGAG